MAEVSGPRFMNVASSDSGVINSTPPGERRNFCFMACDTSPCHLCTGAPIEASRGFESLVLVIDERLQRAHIEHGERSRGDLRHGARDGKKRRLRLSAGRRRRDQDVIGARQDGLNRILLDVTQFPPTLVPHPLLDTRV